MLTERLAPLSNKVHRLIPLYSYFQLPIIVVMKIWLRSDAKGSGGRPLQNQCSAELSLPLPAHAHSQPLAHLVCHLRPPHRAGPIRSTQLARRDFGEDFWSENRISTRFWSKSRSYRKQETKPILPGATTARHVLLVLAQFPRIASHGAVTRESFFAVFRSSRKSVAALLLLSLAAAIPLAAHPSRAAILNSATASPQQSSIPELFGSGEAALRAGNLDQAESSFKKVLAQDPNSAGAYANLGVIAMRRQNWSAALDLLHEAERLAPNVAGIRLNIGLVHYRQSEFQDRDWPVRIRRARQA